MNTAKACNVCELWTEFKHNVDLTTEAIVKSYEELPYKEALELSLSEDEGL